MDKQQLETLRAETWEYNLKYDKRQEVMYITAVVAIFIAYVIFIGEPAGALTIIIAGVWKINDVVRLNYKVRNETQRAFYERIRNAEG